MSATTRRPSFIVSGRDVPEEAGRYPGSDEVMSHGRPIGRTAGLLRIGLHLERLEPGHRTSYPHAERDEEEFVYVIEGEVDAWIDGELHPMRAGDLAAFPAGTGIAHTFLNNSPREAVLLVGGEASMPTHGVRYPLNPETEGALPNERRWDDARVRPLGAHDGRAHR